MSEGIKFNLINNYHKNLYIILLYILRGGSHLEGFPPLYPPQNLQHNIYDGFIKKFTIINKFILLFIESIPGSLFAR